MSLYFVAKNRVIVFTTGHLLILVHFLDFAVQDSALNACYVISAVF